MSKKQVGKYILDKKIGKGSYAQVWLGYCDETKVNVAVKVISRHTISETSQLRQEVAVLKKIDHINIVKFKDLKKSTGHYYLILEYCQGGDLAQFIKKHHHLSELSAQRFLQQISAGLLMLHRLNFIHRDLKPQNILLSDDSENAILKIADFGFARALSPMDMAATVCGSPLYMAPEILRHERYDGKADLWSVGSIFFELLFAHPPFTGPNPMQLLATIESGAIVFPKEFPVSESCRSFIDSILVKDPVDRITPAEFFSHPYNLGEASNMSVASVPEELTLVVEEEAGGSSSDGEQHIVCIDWEERKDEPVVPKIEEGVLVLTGKNRAFAEAAAIQKSGPLAGSFSATLCALAILLRHIAEEVEGNTADKFSLAVRSCLFLDTALDEMVSCNAQSVIELELKLSVETAQKMKSQLSYRDYTECGKPLTRVFAFLQQNMHHSVVIILVDFLLNEFLDNSLPLTNEEDDARVNQIAFLQKLRDSLK